MSGLAPALTNEPLLLFSSAKPKVSIGAPTDESFMPVPVQPDRQSLFAPRGACLFSPDGPLWVSDTGHHRVLGWNQPSEDQQPADWVIGQADFQSEKPNRGGAVTATTLRVPTGICRYMDGLAIADAWNHRILIWHQPPESPDVPADIVLGQADKSSGEPNRGLTGPSANSMHWPYGVAADGERLFVTDTGNRRVLMWNQVPEADGEPANLVLGQSGFDSRDLDGNGINPGGLLRWPHAVQVANEKVFISDAGMHRVLAWNQCPSSNGVPADFVLGQTDNHSAEPNGGGYKTSAEGFNMPYAIAACKNWLTVADTSNSRLLAFPISTLNEHTEATALWAQPNFNSRGDNAWQSAGPQTLSWPYGISASGNRFVIADSGNNRIQIWDWSL